MEVWAVCEGNGVEVPDPEAEGEGENILAAVAAKILPQVSLSYHEPPIYVKEGVATKEKF